MGKRKRRNLYLVSLLLLFIVAFSHPIAARTKAPNKFYSRFFVGMGDGLFVDRGSKDTIPDDIGFSGLASFVYMQLGYSIKKYDSIYAAFTSNADSNASIQLGGEEIEDKLGAYYIDAFSLGMAHYFGRNYYVQFELRHVFSARLDSDFDSSTAYFRGNGIAFAFGKEWKWRQKKYFGLGLIFIRDSLRGVNIQYALDNEKHEYNSKAEHALLGIILSLMIDF